jgi:hypothetical protein
MGLSNPGVDALLNYIKCAPHNPVAPHACIRCAKHTPAHSPALGGGASSPGRLVAEELPPGAADPKVAAITGFTCNTQGDKEEACHCCCLKIGL